ncbi:DEAD/DEAH box helicase [Aggregatilinea lenta]|uniref:DEAD/DEAH box helicase n=1 Tax=Aggregatilinea lenta TaxID=913108 RepID=UPI000E5BC20D|nr:DEAD/DEAH box helicase [Aggregatilinea lenta]
MSAQTEQRLTGTVKWYNRKQGFGFVAPDGGGEDIFVHRSALNNTLKAQIDAGDRIEFFVERRKRGLSATQVTPDKATQESRDPQAYSAGQDDMWEQEQPARTVSPALPVTGFDELGLTPDLLRAVVDAGYTEPTPIQTQAIPDVLAGRDLMGCAQTGTGKTAAFALPILQRLTASSASSAPEAPRTNGKNGKRSGRLPRALILAPTRELALQIGESFSLYGRRSGLNNAIVYGGVGQGPQVQAVRRGVDVLIATPGRLLDLIGQGEIKLDRVEILVLDEADRMLDMGFIHDVRRIVKLVPTDRQTLLFSATIPGEVVELADQMMRNPVQVSVAPEQPSVEAIDQAVFYVPKEKKQTLLEHLLQDRSITRVLVFTRTKHGANKVVKQLTRAGIPAEPIHGNKSQAARQSALKSFRDGETRVLVATDVVARGIDVVAISHVIQFDLPTEPETYIHRIGRTGRAGAVGTAYAFCSDAERGLLKDIQKLIRMRVPVIKDHPFQN